MKKWTALLLALVMCLALCACGGKDDTAPDEKDTQKEEPKPEFVIHNDVCFGMTPAEVSELEPYEISTEDGVLNGLLCGWVKPDKGDFTEFEGYDDASMFYLFDPDSEELEEVLLIFGDSDDGSRYDSFVSLYTKRYGAPSELDESGHTYAYNYLLKDDPDGLQKEGEILDASMWIVPDKDGSVKIELLKAMIFGDSPVVYIGMQHID